MWICFAQSLTMAGIFSFRPGNLLALTKCHTGTWYSHSTGAPRAPQCIWSPSNATTTRARSEHRVIVCRLFRDCLTDIPVFDDFAILNAEDVDDCSRSRLVERRHMKRDEITVGNDTSNLFFVVLVLFQIISIVLDHCLLAIRKIRTVLPQILTHVLGSGFQILVDVELLIELSDDFLIHVSYTFSRTP